MRAFILSAACFVLACGTAYSQDANTKFEVASVKPAAPLTVPARRMSGGPGTSDPERLSWPNMPLKQLLLRAYGRREYQISGPNWLDSTKFDITAKIPPGATKDDLNVMLQTLLVERFNLTFHHESKETAVYELSVGRNGSKLKNADLTPPPEVEPGSRPTTIMPDKEGFLQIPAGRPIIAGKITNGIQRWTARMQEVSGLTSLFESELERPVVDKTGLTGRFDFTLAYSRAGLRIRHLPAGANAAPVDDTPSGGPTLFKAVEDQLGLKLESAKDPIDILVIDHIDKTPTDN